MEDVYFIREKWHINFMGNVDTEVHDEKTDQRTNKVKSIKAVKHFIKEWLESWLENSEDGGHTFLGGETDFISYAKCSIRNESGYVDKFELKVVAKNSLLKDRYVYKFSKNRKFEKTHKTISG